MHKTQIKHKLIKAQITNVSWILFTICVLGFVSFYPRVARADPHAMFYTAIGQQQLFYNVLAALDQADYVETQYAREQLVEKRAKEETTPPFEDEKFPLTEATKVGQERSTSETDPGIADVLSRLITLEGTDLYNDQLVREFGAESGRRNATSELLRALCDYGLGFKDCELDTTGKTDPEIAQMENVRRRAVVKDPLEWASMPFFEGVVGALSSGLEEDTDLRAKRLTDPSDPKGGIPRAFSPEIASWRKAIEAMPQEEKIKQQELLGRLINNVFEDYSLPTGYPYSGIRYSSSGGFTLEDPSYRSPGEKPATLSPADVANAAYNVLFAPINIRRIAERAATRIALQQKMVENEGLLSDVTLKSNPILDDTETPGVNEYLSNYGELTYLVKNPVAVKKADVYSLPVALALLDTSQQASALAGLDKPGSQQLVEREGSEESCCYESASDCPPGTPEEECPLCKLGDDRNVCGEEQVQGLQSTVPGTGQVLGKLDLFGLDKRYDEPKEPTSPSANLIAGHLEQGAVQALRVLTGGNFRKTTGGVPSCGYTCY